MLRTNDSPGPPPSPRSVRADRAGDRAFGLRYRSARRTPPPSSPNAAAAGRRRWSRGRSGDEAGRCRPCIARAVGAGAAPPPVAVPGQPRPFAEVIKDAKETQGLFRIWQKDEKVWIEIAPDQFGVPYLFTVNLSRGVGEQGVYGGMMLADQIVEWKRIGNTVQLIAKNYAFTGGANAPIAQGVKEGFTDSLLGSTTVASQPHPERKTVLVDVERAAVDRHPGRASASRPASTCGTTRSTRRTRASRRCATPPTSRRSSCPRITRIRVRRCRRRRRRRRRRRARSRRSRRCRMRAACSSATRTTSRSCPSRCPRGAPIRASATSKARSGTSRPTPSTRRRTHYVNRWRLEKKDPAAALSEPKEPIVFWIDRNVSREIPAGGARRHPRMEQGVREDRLQGRDRREAAGRRCGVRHLRRAPLDGALVRLDRCRDSRSGPSTVDPRTGEILDAQVAIPEAWSRGDRTFITEQAPSAWPAFDAYRLRSASTADACTYATRGARRDGVRSRRPRSSAARSSRAAPRPTRSSPASLKAVVMHEVGHTLGLRHNFRASTVYPAREDLRSRRSAARTASRAR